jgi:hypothetical protein
MRLLLNKAIFGEDLSHELLQHVSRESLLDLARQLLNDDEGLFFMATHALNFLYNLEYLLGGININPTHMIHIAQSYHSNTMSLDQIKMYIYFLTHCII